MTAAESKRLKVGDCVMWEGDHDDLGVITEAGYCGVKIEWGNGQVGIVDHHGMSKIDRAQNASRSLGPTC